MRQTMYFAVLTLIAGHSAFADTRATEERNLARYEQFASAPVDHFPMWDMYRWQSLGPDRLAVWTGVNKVYLMKVALPCTRLEDAKAIVVTSQMQHQVTRNLDYVQFDTQHCQIIEIRPIDYQAMTKAEPRA